MDQMPERWFFSVQGENVELIARFEGENGTVGEAYDRFEPGDESVSPPGLTYDLLRRAGSGVLEIADDRKSFRIIPASAP